MVTREDLVVQSVTDFAKNGIVAKGYVSSLWQWEEAFNAERMKTWEKTIIGAGFNFDDGGRQAELGSDLMVRVYHIEFYVFGKTLTLGRNIAAALKFALEKDAVIPLMDYSLITPVQIDALQVLATTTHRLTPSSHPEPWEEFAWMTACQVEDYYPSRIG